MSDERNQSESPGPRVSRRIKVAPDYYPEPAKFDRELKRAAPIYEELSKAAAEMINTVRMGQSLQVDLVEKPVADMIKSIIRHPDAMVWQRKLASQHQYLSGHAVRCAVISVVLGRTMGMVEAQLEQLAMGSLLCQVGKTKLPRKLLEKEGPLTDEELEKIRQFIPIGVQMLEDAGVSQEIVEIVANHQERLDGSGYPKGKAENEIPMLARIVALADWYDAMTTRKPHTEKVISATDAMDELYKQRDVLFQGEVVEAFIQGFGIYPCANFVELNSGEVALVEAQNRQNRTQPVIRLVLNSGKHKMSSYETIDLLKHNKTAEAPLTIKRALPDGAFDLDPSEIMAAETSAKKGWLKGMFGR
ncbi:MAG: HD domain-containing phosphohydrolase [Xanthomonadales bacterium]|nr:HD domain-containing phosphohydrolase [Xanthomonadales bacterium]